MYNKRTWLNKPTDPATGNVVAFDGLVKWHGDVKRNTFLSIADCYNVVRLHPTEDCAISDFIEKMRLLAAEIENFADYLEEAELPMNEGEVKKSPRP